VAGEAPPLGRIARAQVVNDEDRFRPGMSFRVIADLEGELYPVVTETGVQWGADGAFIWSIVDDRAERVPVQVVQRRQGRVLVDGNLDSGTIVVVEGIQSMRNGIEVTYETRSFVDESTTSTGRDEARTAGSD